MTNSKNNIDRCEDEMSIKKLLRSSDLDSQFDFIYKFLDSLDIKGEFFYKTIVNNRLNNNEPIKPNSYVVSDGDKGYYTTEHEPSKGDTPINIEDIDNTGVTPNSIVYSDKGILQYLSGNGYIIVEKQGDNIKYRVGENIDRPLDHIHNKFNVENNTVGINCFTEETIENLVDIIIANNPPNPSPGNNTVFRFEDNCFDKDTIDLINLTTPKDIYGVYGDVGNIFNNYKKIENLTERFSFDNAEFLKWSEIDGKNVLTTTFMCDYYEVPSNVLYKSNLVANRFPIKDISILTLGTVLTKTKDVYNSKPTYTDSYLTTQYLIGKEAVGKEHLHPSLRKQLGFE